MQLTGFLAAVPDPGTALDTATKVMSPEGVIITLLLALGLDFLSVGANSIRDRLAFLLAVPAFRDGFDDSPIDNFTVDLLGDLIRELLVTTGGQRYIGVSVNLILGVAVGGIWLYALGCLLPNIDFTQKYAGPLVTMHFPASAQMRINTRLWLCAAALGMFQDLPQGAVGSAIRGTIQFTAGFVGPIARWAFGAA